MQRVDLEAALGSKDRSGSDAASRFLLANLPKALLSTFQMTSRPIHRAHKTPAIADGVNICREIDSDNHAPCFSLVGSCIAFSLDSRLQASRQFRIAVSAAVNGIPDLTASKSCFGSRNAHCCNSHNDCQRSYGHCNQRSSLLNAGLVVVGDVGSGHWF